MKALLFSLVLIPLLLLGKEYETVIIPHPDRSDLKIEFFLLRPTGEGPFPLMFLFHGYQYPGDAPGGKKLIDYSYPPFFLEQGIMVCCFSTPGFGNSEGDPDYSGPFSQNAALAAIDYCKKLKEVDAERIGLYGISRGASLAAMVTARSVDIKLQILEAGRYDVYPAALADLPYYLSGIKEKVHEEAGTTEEALFVRSPVYHTDTMKAATLIICGERDDRRGLPAAQTLHENLKARGIESKLIVFPEALHYIPREKWEKIIPFVREHFFNLYGIGINFGPSVPIPQVSKVFKGGPAEEKLTVGDAILSISPNNDQTEIDTTFMKTSDIAKLVLGQKGAPIRFKILHFDHTIEDIVIYRGN